MASDKLTSEDWALQPLPPLTVREAITQLTHVLNIAGIQGASTDARWLVAACLSLSPASLIAHPERPLSAAEQARLSAATARRQSREPVSRILGSREFYGRPFVISPAVLDPRADSETIIDVVLEAVGETRADGQRWRILDIGTGSGALLLTLLAHCPTAHGTGLDISAAALEIAALNAHNLGLTDRATFSCGDLRDGLPSGFDIIVANPPYIASAELAGLAPEVVNFDPALALDGGPDGLDYYRAIVRHLAMPHPVHAHPSLIAFEVGAGQAADVAEILFQIPHQNGELIQRRDLGGHLRCVALKTHY